MKKNKHIIIFLTLFIALIVFEYMQPKAIDWKVSYSKKEKIPFGSYIMYDLLEDIYKNSKIEVNDRSPFRTFRENEYENASYIIITQDFNPVTINLEALLNFVNKGNKVFISASKFKKAFKDSLNFNTNYYFSSSLIGDSLSYNFFNPDLKADSDYYLKSSPFNIYIDSVDNENVRKIAYFDSIKLNFFRQKYGEGEFFINTQPYAFTNYNLLQDSALQYSIKAFSFANNSTIIWDEFYKPGKYNSSPMSYILSQESLRKAWYMVLILVAVFLILGSKRRQNVIPVINRPRNSSLDFTKTLANLYLSGKNHKDIALKKYSYWLNFLRRKYLLKFETNQMLSTSTISEKTGVDKTIIKKIIEKKQDIDLQKTISPETLLKLNELIDEFYLNCE